MKAENWVILGMISLLITVIVITRDIIIIGLTTLITLLITIDFFVIKKAKEVSE